MKSMRSKGIKGEVMISVRTDDAREETRVYRGGRLGLASHAPYGRVFGQTGEQIRSTPMVTRRRMRGPMSQS